MNRNDQLFIAQRIRTQYTKRELTELDELRTLDSKVKRPANIFAYVFGSVSAVIMGAGMSLVMTDIGATVGIENSMVAGIIIGIIGLGMTLVNYPIYNRIMSARKKKYAQQILELSDRIMDK